MSWKNLDKSGAKKINWNECEKCMSCKKLTDHKTGYCIECRRKLKLGVKKTTYKSLKDNSCKFI